MCIFGLDDGNRRMYSSQMLSTCEPVRVLPHSSDSPSNGAAEPLVLPDPSPIIVIGDSLYTALAILHARALSTASRLTAEGSPHTAYQRTRTEHPGQGIPSFAVAVVVVAESMPGPQWTVVPPLPAVGAVDAYFGVRPRRARTETPSTLRDEREFTCADAAAERWAVLGGGAK